MTEISVKTKMWSLVIIMLLFIFGVGAVGYVTLDKGANTYKELVELDEEFLNLIDQAHLKIIQLRRFEKDYFLNIGNPAEQEKYLKKYQEIEAAVPQLMDKMADLARINDHLDQDLKAKVATLAGLYEDYRAGFYALVQQLNNNPSLTPQQANSLMAKYKANIPILEEDMAVLGQASKEAADRLEAQALQRNRSARVFIVAAVLVAAVLAGVLGSALCRSIYRAIFREGLRRMAHRI
ncbi:MAG: MCP four helix bundle domain-containing protein [Thermodesulfobacteriota bacterium]